MTTETSADKRSGVADCSAAEEKRLRGNVRFFCDDNIPWCQREGRPHLAQVALVQGWNEQLVTAGLEPEPTMPNYALLRRRWWKSGCAPYDIPEVWTNFPTTLKKSYSKLPQKYVESYDKYC